MLRRIIVQNNIFKKLKMKTKLKIALVAHDQRKADMVDWVKFNAQYLHSMSRVPGGTPHPSTQYNPIAVDTD